MVKSRSSIIVLGVTGTAAVAIAACGPSSNSAPIVYGTEPAQARVYNSPAEVYLEKPSRVGTAPNTAGPVVLSQNPSDYAASVSTNAQAPSQGVRIYNAPPSAPGGYNTVRQPTYDQQAYVQPAYVNTAVVAQTELRPIEVSQNYSPADVVQPAYRGLPPAPTYRSAGVSETGVAATAALAQRPQASGNAVIVQPGDTVYAIARRTGHSPKDIIDVNRLPAPYALTIGQTLRLPVRQTPNAPVDTTYRPAEQTYAPRPVQAATPQSLRPTSTQPASQLATQAAAYTAPVVQPVSREVIARDALYTVAPGDTLYSIARRNGITVKSITDANRIGSVYDLKVGQQLLLPAVPVNRAAVPTPTYRPASPTPSSPAASSTTPSVRTAPASPRVAPQPIPETAPPAQSIEGLTREASYTSKRSLAGTFDWPVKGSVISTFGTGGIGRRNDGINIAAPQGATIRAAADGEVVYRGSELDGYGNLLLIKHDGGFVTAYAHNDVMLVRKGQKVKRGQIIAKVGETGAVTEPQLHFEIRQNLKSVDPMQFLASN